MSYAVFNYPSGGIQWYDNKVLVGFNKGDLDGTALPLPNSKSNYVNLLEFQSNIGKPGQWAFRIDPDIIQLDNCSPNPCGHGICQSTGAGFTCECDDNWFGDKCDVSPCVALDCMNSGVCTATSPTSATCSCPAGISGNRCQISPCSSNPCPAGIACVVTSPGPSYMCDCILFFLFFFFFFSFFFSFFSFFFLSFFFFFFFSFYYYDCFLLLSYIFFSLHFFNNPFFFSFQ